MPVETLRWVLTLFPLLTFPTASRLFPRLLTSPTAKVGKTSLIMSLVGEEFPEEVGIVAATHVRCLSSEGATVHRWVIPPLELINKLTFLKTVQIFWCWKHGALHFSLSFLYCSLVAAEGGSPLRRHKILEADTSRSFLENTEPCDSLECQPPPAAQRTILKLMEASGVQRLHITDATDPHAGPFRLLSSLFVLSFRLWMRFNYFVNFMLHSCSLTVCSLFYDLWLWPATVAIY